MLARTSGPLTGIVTHLLERPGKRLRPILVILAASLGEADPRAIIHVGAAVELIHLASLVHDDIIDGAKRRRGRPSVAAKWGNHTAVLVGDYLWAQAYMLLTCQAQYGVVGTMSGAIADMCQGELTQLASLYDPSGGEEAYLTRIRLKTASLFAACCRAGAQLAGLDPACTEALADFGLQLGFAFQLKDDVLDFTASARTLGKPVGSDLRRGILTLPALRLLDDSQHGPVLRACLEARRFARGELRRLYKAAQDSGAVTYALQSAGSRLQAARRQLLSLPPAWAREQLLGLVESLAAAHP